jgi:hypothetical protein
MLAYGKVIISEKYLLDSWKSIKPLSRTDDSTYTAEVCNNYGWWVGTNETQGILFSFVLDKLIGHQNDSEICEFGGLAAVDDEKGTYE